MEYRINNWLCAKDSGRETLFVSDDGESFFSVPKDAITKVDAISYTIESARVKGFRLMDSSVYNLSATAKGDYVEGDMGYVDADDMLSSLASMNVSTAYGTKAKFDRGIKSKTDYVTVPNSCIVLGESVLQDGSDYDSYMVVLPGEKDVSGFLVEKNDLKGNGHSDSKNLLMPKEGTLLVSVYGDDGDFKVVNMPVSEARDMFTAEMAKMRGWNWPEKRGYEGPDK